MSVIERLLVRCTLPTCARWLTIAPPADPRTCPSCALSGVVSQLEAVDMAAHIASLPVGKDPQAK